MNTDARHFYEDRLQTVVLNLTNVFEALQKDPVIDAMQKDSASAVHISDRCAEVLKEFLHSEEESLIQQLQMQLHHRDSELDKLHADVSKSQSIIESLEQQLSACGELARERSGILQKESRLAEEVAALSHENELLRDELEKAIDGLQGSSVISTSLKELRSSLKVERKKRGKLEGSVEELKSEKREMKNKLKEMHISGKRLEERHSRAQELLVQLCESAELTIENRRLTVDDKFSQFLAEIFSSDGFVLRSMVTLDPDIPRSDAMRFQQRISDISNSWQSMWNGVCKSLSLEVSRDATSKSDLEKIRFLEDEVSRLEILVSKLHSKVAKYKQKSISAGAPSFAANSSLDIVDSVLSAIDRKRSSEVDAEREYLHSVVQTVDSMRHEIQRLTNAHSMESKQKDEELSKCNEQCKTLAETLEMSQQRASQFEKDLQNMSSSKELIRKELENVVSKSEELSDKYLTVARRFDDSQTRCKVLEQKCKSLESQLSESSTRLSSSEEEVLRVQKASRDAERTVSQLERQIEMMKTVSQENMKRSEKEKDRVEEELRNIQSDLSERLRKSQQSKEDTQRSWEEDANSWRRAMAETAERHQSETNSLQERYLSEIQKLRSTYDAQILKWRQQAEAAQDENFTLQQELTLVRRPSNTGKRPSLRKENVALVRRQLNAFRDELLSIRREMVSFVNRSQKYAQDILTSILKRFENEITSEKVNIQSDLRVQRMKLEDEFMVSQRESERIFSEKVSRLEIKLKKEYEDMARIVQDDVHIRETQFEKELANQKALAKRLENDVKNVSDQLQKSEQRNASLESDRSEIEEKHATERIRLESRNRILQDNYNNVLFALEEMADLAGGVQNDDTWKQFVASLRMEGKIEKQTQYRGLPSSVQSKFRQSRESAAELEELRKRVPEQESIISQLEHQISAKSLELSVQKSDYNLLETEVEGSKKAGKILKDTEGILRQQLEMEQSDSKRKILALEGTISTLKSALEKIERDYQELTESHKRRIEEDGMLLRALRKRLDEKEQALANEEQSKEELLNRASVTQQENAQLKGQLDMHLSTSEPPSTATTPNSKSLDDIAVKLSSKLRRLSSGPQLSSSTKDFLRKSGSSPTGSSSDFRSSSHL
eukprot:ANDGO_06713.mRNA.1 hypothetical protein